MSCKEICRRYKFVRNKTSRQFYLAGASRCQAHCGGIFLRWDGVWCPCCGFRLRKKPRNKHGKLMTAEIDSHRMGDQEVPKVSVTG